MYFVHIVHVLCDVAGQRLVIFLFLDLYPANKPSGMCRSDGVTTKLYLHAKYNIKLGKRRREAGGKKD